MKHYVAQEKVHSEGKPLTLGPFWLWFESGLAVPCLIQTGMMCLMVFVEVER